MCVSFQIHFLLILYVTNFAHLLFSSRVEYRYSLLNQSQRERDIDHDLENALHPTSVVFDDSDEEVRSKVKVRP